jgi:hypothetical protein
MDGSVAGYNRIRQFQQFGINSSVGIGRLPLGVGVDPDRYTLALDVDLTKPGSYCMDVAQFEAAAVQMVALMM